ncbi:bifunctional pyr operon transcriptional regulator/uracil phosphoribosyltransferase PyrR [Spirochaetota bacterium]
MSEKVILNSEDIDRIISDLSKEICNDIKDFDHFAIVGIQTRGVELTGRIKNKLEELSGKTIQSGMLDITFYRDDIATRGVLPIIKETRIDFDITKMVILLVDDVIFSGRTIKAALETLMSFGRPSAIKLFALVDRGNRDLPIQPDYCGHKVDTDVDDNINVLLKEIDDVSDSIVLIREE